MALLQSAEQTPLGVDPRAVIPLPSTARSTVLSPPVDGADRRRVALLRDLLAEARLAGREDVEKMCALIAASPSTTARRYGVALFQALPDATPRRLTFNTRGAQTLSVDEMWLIRLLKACETGDQVNIAALIGFRITRKHQRRIRFLVSGLASSIDGLDGEA